jgi:2-polyprenyl-3-methyl-5-hydroxy-6-metoxy-1,4-benzoquinol methylase
VSLHQFSLSRSIPGAKRSRMEMENPRQNARRVRLLVAIASYGDGHLEFLGRIIHMYQSMDMDVDVVVFSEAAKELGPEVEVVVGLPSKNPWTLPFAHKAVFARQVEQYDLFVYSEDDIGVSEGQIRAFLSAADQLAQDEIAGFLRYEVDESGKRFVAEPWGHYHWKPESVKVRGTCTIAEFTNEHAGFYILTQAQLRRAIASGGFLRGPCRGRYGWPETAATDPYTNCGFRKVICISDLENFLVHHMSNRYANGLPVSLASFKEQVQTLNDICTGVHPAYTLWEAESKQMPFWWQKWYYDKPSEELLEMIPGDAKCVLSIGCGRGDLEAKLMERGASVTAIPMDTVIGAAAQRRGINVVYGTWDECIKRLEGQRFDCVFIKDLLHLQPNPGQLLKQGSRFVAEHGALVIAGPNFDRVPWLIKRVFGIDGFDKLRSFELSGFSVCVPRTLAQQIEDAGLRIKDVCWLNHNFDRGFLFGKRINLGKFTAKDWVLQACR